MLQFGAVARQSGFPLNLSTQTGFRQGGDSVVKVELGVKVSNVDVLSPVRLMLVIL